MPAALSAQPWATSRAVRTPLLALERELVQHAHEIIVVSEVLQRRMAAMGRTSTLISHGTDLAMWQGVNSTAARFVELEREEREARRASSGSSAETSSGCGSLCRGGRRPVVPARTQQPAMPVIEEHDGVGGEDVGHIGSFGGGYGDGDGAE